MKCTLVERGNPAKPTVAKKGTHHGAQRKQVVALPCSGQLVHTPKLLRRDAVVSAAGEKTNHKTLITKDEC
jgi:hypothetical protein